MENSVPHTIRNKLLEWFNKPLKDWDVSRDSPYFGFPIPNVAEKYFYVWLDAPIGYLSSFKNFALSNNNPDLNKWVKNAPDNNVEIYHFIGKDIAYFHAIFYQALLYVSEYKNSKSLFIHGFLNINGEKMSKSKGTFITADEFSSKYNSDFLRYYFASKQNSSIEDINFNISDFIQKINSDIIGKLVNIPSRLFGLLKNQILTDNFNKELFIEINTKYSSIISHEYENRNYKKIIELCIEILNIINQKITETQPWKQTDIEYKTMLISEYINLVRIVFSFLRPIIPNGVY